MKKLTISKVKLKEFSTMTPTLNNRNSKKQNYLRITNRPKYWYKIKISLMDTLKKPAKRKMSNLCGKEHRIINAIVQQIIKLTPTIILIRAFKIG